jgi:hypothetical protein
MTSISRGTLTRIIKFNRADIACQPPNSESTLVQYQDVTGQLSCWMKRALRKVFGRSEHLRQQIETVSYFGRAKAMYFGMRKLPMISRIH